MHLVDCRQFTRPIAFRFGIDLDSVEPTRKNLHPYHSFVIIKTRRHDMAQATHSVDRNALEKGFNAGVKRATGNNLPENDIRKDQDELLGKIQLHMEAISAKEVAQKKPRPNWSPRGVEHAAEDITIFEMAWRTERPRQSLAITDQEIEAYLLVFRACSNCWSHD
jgi:hypothetical protein